jgi:endonuclease/exonuclease/phosphatase family metal-dependent hydrolase
MKIRLGTFNLFQFVEPPYSWYTKKDKFNERQWLEKTTWIKNQILKMNCDIIGFQEVFSRKALKNLVKDLGFNYFKVVDVAKLSKNNRLKYVTTTVAIASKYPIANVQVVEPHLPSIEKHHLEEPFRFSRIPIKAMITLPNKEELLVYVCHLKSNRLNAFEYVFHAHHSLEHKKELISKTFEHKSAASLKQRLCEASSLFFDIKKYKNQPTVLLCDLNDKEFSITIDALSNHKYHDDKSKENLVLHDASYQYKEEVYNPHPEAKETKRKATSYFVGKGNVLDYIFISNHFNKNNKDNIAEVTDYTVLDDHLQENKDGSLLQSDHAQVVCELTFL